MRVCISTRLTNRGSGMPFAMKRAVSASRIYVNRYASSRKRNMIFTCKRHPPLLHLTANVISQISVCQMSVDKRFLYVCSRRCPHDRGLDAVRHAKLQRIFERRPISPEKFVILQYGTPRIRNTTLPVGGYANRI